MILIASLKVSPAASLVFFIDQLLHNHVMAFIMAQHPRRDEGTLKTSLGGWVGQVGYFSFKVEIGGRCFGAGMSLDEG